MQKSIKIFQEKLIFGDIVPSGSNMWHGDLGYLEAWELGSPHVGSRHNKQNHNNLCMLLYFQKWKIISLMINWNKLHISVKMAMTIISIDKITPFSQSKFEKRPFSEKCRKLSTSVEKPTRSSLSFAKYSMNTMKLF